MSVLQRWRERVRRTSPSGPEGATWLRLELRRLEREVEEGLREIDFEEVTTDDRITFVEAVVAWRVRLALRAGRFDLALEIQRLGAARAVQLYERHYGRHPILLYGAPRRQPEP